MTTIEPTVKPSAGLAAWLDAQTAEPLPPEAWLTILDAPAELTKAGFNPDQPRGEHGKWGGGNGTPSRTFVLTIVKASGEERPMAQFGSEAEAIAYMTLLQNAKALDADEVLRVDQSHETSNEALNAEARARELRTRPPELTKAGYDPSQARAQGGEDAGQWTSQGGGGGPAFSQAGADAANAHMAAFYRRMGLGYDPGVTLTPASGRVYEGEPVAVKGKLGKSATGKIGEAVITAWLQEHGFPDARPYSTGRNNAPIDVMADHTLYEIKAGQVSNSKGAQQWRITEGEPGDKETALVKKMSPRRREAWHDMKIAAALERKAAKIAEASAQRGYEVKARTMSIIFNPDTRTADVFAFDKFHPRIGWNSEQARKGYLGTVHY